jgi:homocysteine S-methyltransferase
MKSGNLRNEIEKNGVLFLDGGLATTLELNGETLDPKLWSAEKILSNPNCLEKVHEQFLEAGCDIITTSSYQMSYEGFKERGYTDLECENFFRDSTTCADNARKKIAGVNPVFIAASIGCYGAHLADGSEYRGIYGLSSSELLRWHQRKFNILAESGVDLLACETIPCVAEARAFRDLLSLEESSEETDVNRCDQGWISCSCRSGHALNSGEEFEDVIRLFTDPSETSNTTLLSSWGFGVNCTNPEKIVELLDIIRGTGAMSGYRPIVVYPNKGENWNAIDRCWVESSGCTDDSFGQSSREWRESGANIIGGCCRTTPDTIRNIIRTLHSN